LWTIVVFLVNDSSVHIIIVLIRITSSCNIYLHDEGGATRHSHKISQSIAH